MRETKLELYRTSQYWVCFRADFRTVGSRDHRLLAFFTRYCSRILCAVEVLGLRAVPKWTHSVFRSVKMTLPKFISWQWWARWSTDLCNWSELLLIKQYLQWGAVDYLPGHSSHFPEKQFSCKFRDRSRLFCRQNHSNLSLHFSPALFWGCGYNVYVYVARERGGIIDTIDSI